MEQNKESVTMAMQIGKEIMDKLSDLPERAEEFAISVEQKTVSIIKWVEENDHATDKQINSLQNMNAGIDKWLR